MLSVCLIDSYLQLHIVVCVLQSNHKLHLQLIDLEYQKSSLDLEAMATLFSRAIDGPLATEHRVAFSQRRLEFLEDFGSNVMR